MALIMTQMDQSKVQYMLMVHGRVGNLSVMVVVMILKVVKIVLMISIRIYPITMMILTLLHYITVKPMDGEYLMFIGMQEMI